MLAKSRYYLESIETKSVDLDADNALNSISSKGMKMRNIIDVGLKIRYSIPKGKFGKVWFSVDFCFTLFTQ